MSTITKRQYEKYIKNPLFLNAMIQTLRKMIPLLDECWDKHTSYNYGTWNSKTGTYDKPEGYRETVTLMTSISKTENNYKLQYLVETAVGYQIYGNKFFDSNGLLYDWNSKFDRKKEDVLKIVNDTIEALKIAETRIEPQAEALPSVKSKQYRNSRRIKEHSEKEDSKAYHCKCCPNYRNK